MTDRAQLPAVAVAFVALAILAVGGAYVFGAAYDDTATLNQTFTNETFTPSPSGQALALAESNNGTVIYDASVTVFDENDTEMSNPSDYEWLQQNGTIVVNSTGRLDGDSSGKITYGYRVGDQQQQAVKRLTESQSLVLRVLLWVAVLGLAVAGLARFS
jgi:hypothetical protein